MTDFLSRLVERSTATSPVPLPVVAPLFALGPAIAPSPITDEMEPAEAAPQPRWLPAATPMVPAAPSLGAKEPAPVRARADELVDRPSPPVFVSPSPPGSADRDPGVAWPARGLVAQPQGIIEPSRVARPPAAAIARSDPGPREIRGPVQQGVPVLPALHPVQRELPRLAEAQPAGGRRAHPDPPIVRISIGRIEVRAVTPPAATPPRSAPAPKRAGVVLEDYLRARNRDR